MKKHTALEKDEKWLIRHLINNARKMFLKLTSAVMKPKIKRVGRFWVCGGPYEIAGYGRTPCEAYLNWRNQWF